MISNLCQFLSHYHHDQCVHPFYNVYIAGATFSDSGNYTCMMGRTAKTQIELQIIPGKVGGHGQGGQHRKIHVSILTSSSHNLEKSMKQL